MVIHAIIQARMSSTRLPGKVLMPILSRPMVSYMIERVRAVRCIDRVILATSNDITDDPIETFCEKEGIACFRGNLDDVLDRYYQAATAYPCDVVVRLTGDCPLIDPSLIQQACSAYRDNRYDYVATTVPPQGTVPDGMDVEVFSYVNLKKAWEEARKPSEREHVTFYFWKNPRKFSIHRCEMAQDLSSYRLTVDYEQDFVMVTKIFEHLYQTNPLFTVDDIIGFLNSHPDIQALNKNIQPNQGWRPALEKDKQAGFTVHE